jgi:REP element-mobilizing transposase RayT
LGIRTLSAIRAAALLDLELLSTPANFATPHSRACFESSWERVRQSYGLGIYGYVGMPEHVHLLLNEAERGCLAQRLQSLKQSVARTLALRAAESFWQARSYDFKVWSEHKFVEKLRYIHRHPVVREWVERPEDWLWSSLRHYFTGTDGVIEIECSGQHCAEKNWGSCRPLAFTKTPPKRSLSGAA